MVTFLGSKIGPPKSISSMLIALCLPQRLYVFLTSNFVFQPCLLIIFAVNLSLSTFCLWDDHQWERGVSQDSSFKEQVWRERLHALSMGLSHNH